MPEGEVDQYRVVPKDENFDPFFYGKVMGGVNRVTIQEPFVQQLDDFANPSSAYFQVETRLYEGSNNYARSKSPNLVLEAPQL